MSSAEFMRKYELKDHVVYLGFIAIFLFFAVTLHDAGFTSTRNLTNILLQTAPATIMAIGLVFALSAGEIDLSFGSIVAVAALARRPWSMQAMPMPLGVLAGLGAGLAIGAIERPAIVAWLRLPSFLVTLATLRAVRGRGAHHDRPALDSRSRTMPRSPASSARARHARECRRWCGGRSPGSRSLTSVYRHSPLRRARARHRRQRARRAGVGHQGGARALSWCSRCAAAAPGSPGLLYAGRLQAAKYTLGESDLMIVIAAVIVGGTALNGGKGSIDRRAGRLAADGHAQQRPDPDGAGGLRSDDRSRSHHPHRRRGIAARHLTLTGGAPCFSTCSLAETRP